MYIFLFVDNIVANKVKRDKTITIWKSIILDLIKSEVVTPV